MQPVSVAGKIIKYTQHQRHTIFETILMGELLFSKAQKLSVTISSPSLYAIQDLYETSYTWRDQATQRIENENQSILEREYR